MNIKEWLRKGEKEDVFLISDIAKHGCSGGVSGLIYYRETRAFHDEHEEEIWDLVAEYAENEGCKLMELGTEGYERCITIGNRRRQRTCRENSTKDYFSVIPFP